MTREDLERVHAATLRILEEIGVRLEHDDVAAKVIRAGARPGADAHVVRFPGEMIGECLALAPREVKLSRRDGREDVLASGSPPVFWTHPGMYLMMFAIHAHMAHGVSLVWGLGQLESEKTMSLAQLVIHDEMVSLSRRHERGFSVDDETLAFDLIREVGIGGSYLETEHTLSEYKKHLWHPALLNRKVRQNGAVPLEEAARKRAEELLAADRGEKLPDPERRELRRIEDAYKQLIH